MSSAAKLRRFGKGTAAVATAAMVMTAFGPAAFAQWDDAPQTPVVEAAQNVGTIGIVDTDVPINQVHAGHAPHVAGPVDNGDYGPGGTVPEATANHGATLVQAGRTGQAIADIRLTLPNRFRAGDIIDLRLLDRSATEHKDGRQNSGPDTLVGFSANPTLTVSEPMAAGTRVGAATGALTADTESVDPVNTETAPVTAWVAPAGATGVAATKPGVAPTFEMTRQQTLGAQGYDNLQLRVTSNMSTGDPNAVWVLTLTDVKVDLGTSVTPGELRVVPFATNKNDNNDNRFLSPWFQGNAKADALTAAGSSAFTPFLPNREIQTYTVPAYVSPVMVTSDKTDIIADGTPQAIGTLSLTETKPYALATGTYRLWIDGATIANPGSTDIKVALTGGDTGESATILGSGNTGGRGYVDIAYTANPANPTAVAKIDVTGLQLRTTTATQLRFSFTGDTLNSTWFAVAGTSGAVGTQVASSEAFIDDDADPVNAGPDPAEAGPIAVASTRVLRQTYVNPPTLAPSAGAALLPGGQYVVTASGTGFILTGPATIGTAADPVINGVAYDFPAGSTNLYTFTNLEDGQTVTIGTTNNVIETVATTPITATNLDQLPPGSYSVSAVTGGYRIMGNNGVSLGVVGAPVANGAAFTTTAANSTGLPIGATYTFTELGAAETFVVTGTAAYTLVPGVNEKDIVAPDYQLMQTGIAQAQSNRVGGNNRYETAMKVAANWPTVRSSGKLRSVIIASGQNFPDALSSSYLSQRTDSPILLTMRDQLPSDTLDFLKRHFVEEVFIVGGEQAVSAAVQKQLEAQTIWNPRTIIPLDVTPVSSQLPLKVTRLGGGSRYTTNELVNYFAAAWGGGSRFADITIPNTVGKTVVNYGEPGKFTAIVASGNNWPDALAGGILTAGVRADNQKYPASINPLQNDAERLVQWAKRARNALPLILTEGQNLSEAASNQFHRLDIQHAVLVGGADVLSDANVMKKIDALNITTARLAGENRYATAVEVNKWAMTDDVPAATNRKPGLGFIGAPGTNEATAYLAQGYPAFADALSVAPKVGAEYNVLALVQPKDITPWTKAFLEEKAHDILRVIGVGLGDAVSASVLNDASRAVSLK